MPLVVHIDVAEPPSSAMVRELEKACEAALPEQSRCVAGGGDDTAGPRAVVVWLDEAHGQILVRARGRDDKVRERTLSFRASDPEPQRWKAVGFAVGTLFDGDDGGQPPPPSPAPPAAASSAPPSSGDFAPAPPPTVPSKPRDLAASMSGVALLGAGGTVAFGAELRGSVDVGRLAFTLALGGTADHPSGPLEQRFLWLSLGPQFDLVKRRSAWAGARAELLAEEVYVEHHGVGQVVETRSRVVPGVRGGVFLEVPVSGWVRLVAATDAGLRAGKTRLVVGSADAPTVGVLRVDVALGLGGRF